MQQAALWMKSVQPIKVCSCRLHMPQPAVSPLTGFLAEDPISIMGACPSKVWLAMDFLFMCSSWSLKTLNLSSMSLVTTMRMEGLVPFHLITALVACGALADAACKDPTAHPCPGPTAAAPAPVVETVFD